VKARRALKRDDLYGKTGTTNDSIDTWFAGFQPTMVGVARSATTPRQLGVHGETGGSLPIGPATCRPRWRARERAGGAGRRAQRRSEWYFGDPPGGGSPPWADTAAPLPWRRWRARPWAHLRSRGTQPHPRLLQVAASAGGCRRVSHSIPSPNAVMESYPGGADRHRPPLSPATSRRIALLGAIWATTRSEADGESADGYLRCLGEDIRHAASRSGRCWIRPRKSCRPAASPPKFAGSENPRRG
jgi:hypothetical protein